MDGALVSWEVGRDLAGELAQPLVYRSGDARVISHRYSFSTNVGSIQSRTLHVLVGFFPYLPAQPAAVTRTYGDGGNNMFGSHEAYVGEQKTIQYEFNVQR
jgi:hypothetical protein